MSTFSHDWNPESRSRGGKARGDSQAQRQWKARMARLNRIRSGDHDQTDRATLMRYHRADVKEGLFDGPLDAWLKLHGVTLPDLKKVGGDTEQCHIEAAVKIAGPEVAWGLLRISGQIPPMPAREGSTARMFA